MLLDKDSMVAALQRMGIPASESEGSLEFAVLGNRIETYLVPGSELKARYAFEDLWESVYG